VLPLDGKGQILLAGPGCHSLAALHGSWSYTWQGTDEAAYPEGLQTILQSFNDGYGRENVLWARGAQWDGSTDFDYAMNKARNADVVVCVLGEKPSTETPGNIPDLSMPDNQLRLVRRLATGKPLILVLLGNRPRLITEIAGHCHAIVYAGQPGPHGGKALYELLTGQFNPSGRLPFTYPRHPNSLLTYDHKHSDSVGPDKETPGFNPLYEFGHGLSYTSFAFSDLELKSSTLMKSDEILLSVRVSNTGSRAGKETVHVFTRDLFASITPQVKRLRAFSQIELKAGESKIVTFKIPVKELAYHNLENASVLEPGEFDVMVGDLTERILVK
jgi:beta-glucosidase